ncbi:MAG: LPS export ABC transporter permease LptG [Deltaproteobacteria bacterium]|nr:LPS export ABC transporter permease LptG [Deltaproteobacteria bacterium]
MKILSKYLAKEFTKLLILCQIIFVFIYLMIDFVQKIDNFVHAQVSTMNILSFLIYKIPFIFTQMLPVTTLISIIIMFSLLAKRNEFTAMKACGLDIFRVTQPVFVSAVLLGMVCFILNELVVPYTSSKSNEIWDLEVRKRDPTQFRGINQIWYKSADAIYSMRHFDYANQSMERPTFYFFDDSFRLIKIIDGKKAVWIRGKWHVEQGTFQEFDSKGGYETGRFETLRLLSLKETPETFLRSFGEKEMSPEDMSFLRLKRYAQRVIMEGYDNREYLVYMNYKISFPFIILIMVLIGIPISMKYEKRGTPFAISLGVCLCFLYYVVLGFSRSMGLSGTLPPILSAWLTNLVFLFFGVYLMMKVER